MSAAAGILSMGGNLPLRPCGGRDDVECQWWCGVAAFQRRSRRADNGGEDPPPGGVPPSMRRPDLDQPDVLCLGGNAVWCRGYGHQAATMD
jgi:hypothetical protein